MSTNGRELTEQERAASETLLALKEAGDPSASVQLQHGVWFVWQDGRLGLMGDNPALGRVMLNWEGLSRLRDVLNHILPKRK